MTLASRMRSWVRAMLRRTRMENEMSEELRFHVEAYAADLVRGGMPRAEAVRRAKMEFGGAERVKEECREARGISFIESLLQDLRFGLRMLRKSPGFTTIAVLTLALGIGANAAIFSIIDGVLLKPLPYPHPEQLVSVEVSPLALNPSLRGMAPEEYFVFRDQSRTFQDIGIYAETDTDRDVNVTGFSEPERVHALNVTEGVLSSLGIPPMYGRIFAESDDAPGAPPTAILTYGYWQRRFGADTSAVGKTILVDGRARQIIGVLPANFRFLDMQGLALILPLQLDRNKIILGNFSYFGIARLKPRITLSQASADVARMLPFALHSFPAGPGLSLDLLEKSRLAPNLWPLKQDVVGNVGTLLWVLMGGIGMVLLIACANVANLFLVRTEGRRHELALRAALGASRGRISMQLLNESAIIGLLGSVSGLALAWAALRFLVAHAPAGLPRVSEIGINLPALIFTLAIALFTTLFFGLIPVLKHAGIHAGLFESSRIVGQSHERHRARNLLVTLQVALAMVLLICSGLMIRTFLALRRVNPGFSDPPKVQTFRISIPPSDVPDDSQVARVEQQIQDKLAAIPGVTSVAFSTAVPMDGDSRLDNIFAEDRIYSPGEVPPLRHLVFISPGYLNTLGIPLIAGRDFNWTDTYNKIPVALISENLAREYWSTPAAALGKRIRISAGDDWRQVIGVVGDVRDNGMDQPPATDVYWPVLVAKFQGRPLRANRYTTFVARSPLAGSESLVNQIRQTVWSVDVNLPLASVRTMKSYYRGSLARTAFTLVMLGIAGAMALFLGAMGLYGVIAYSVSRRTHEIGVRVALGAWPRDIVCMVLGEGLLIAIIGIAIGMAGALAFTRFLRSLLFEIKPTDSITYLGVAILLLLVALAACWIPARRAMKVDPMVALRYE